MSIATLKSLGLSQIKPGSLPQISASHASLQVILQLFFGVVGALAVLFVVIGGFRYIISDGDPRSAAEGKKTIIFAAVGLIVAVSGEALVIWVLKLA